MTSDRGMLSPAQLVQPFGVGMGNSELGWRDLTASVLGHGGYGRRWDEMVHVWDTPLSVEQRFTNHMGLLPRMNFGNYY